MDAREVAELKDNINTMIDNLRGPRSATKTRTGSRPISRSSRMLQGQRDLFTVGEMLLSELAPLVNAQRGTIYQMTAPDGETLLRRLASYASSSDLPIQ